MRILFRWCVVVGVVAGSSLSVPAQAPDVARMEQVIRPYVDSQQFMGALLVAKGDALLLNKGYGFADVEWAVPNAPEAKFRLGSLTKQFTAASILLLEERGSLKVEDPVSKYLPNTPKSWEKITIFNLLTHTSGIPNFTNFSEFGNWQLQSRTVADELAYFRDKPLEFQPGEKFSYSNSGYAVLGAVIEKVSGKSYGEFLQANLFGPLGMKDSGLDRDGLVLPKRAEGYVLGPKGLEVAGYGSMSVPFSAGALYSTTGDLLRWERGLFGGKVLRPESLTKMTSPFKENYAFGLLVSKQDGVTRIEHGGGIQGFNTALAYYPEKQLTVVVLGNVNGSAPDDIARKLATIAMGGAVVTAAERKEVPIAAADLAKYVGTYELAPAFAIAFEVEGNQLMTQATGQPKFPVFYEGGDRFFLKVVDAEVQFVEDPTGKVTSLVLFQGGREMKGAKK